VKSWPVHADIRQLANATGRTVYEQAKAEALSYANEQFGELVRRAAVEYCKTHYSEHGFVKPDFKFQVAIVSSWRSKLLHLLRSGIINRAWMDNAVGATKSPILLQALRELRDIAARETHEGNGKKTRLGPSGHMARSR
jgi:hypothetical protein